jgi:hypothetical protein
MLPVGTLKHPQRSSAKVSRNIRGSTSDIADNKGKAVSWPSLVDRKVVHYAAC